MKKTILLLLCFFFLFKAFGNDDPTKKNKTKDVETINISESEWYLGSKSISFASSLTINSSTPTICPGTGGSATLTSTACNLDEVVNWFLGSSNVAFASGNTTINVVPVSTSTYVAKCINNLNVVSVTSNSLTITIPFISTPSSLSKNPSSNVSPGTNVTLTANGCTASGNSVKWEDNSTTNPRIVAPTISTTYSFKCVFGSCESSSLAATVGVLPPTPVITTSASSICSGSFATLNATGCTNPDVVEWFLGIASVSFTSGTSSIAVNPVSNSAYTAKCTGVTGTSPASNSISISVINVNTPSGITVSPSNSVGPNTNVRLTANGCESNTVKWEDNSTLNPRTILPIATATYSFKCVNGICESSGNSSTTIVFQPCPNSIILATTTNDITSGSNVYRASSSSGTIEASNKITGLGTIVTFNAGKSILLQNGFLADNSTIFKAEIGGCS